MKKHIKPIKNKKQTPHPPAQKATPIPVKAIAKEKDAEKEMAILAERYASLVNQKKHRNAYAVSLEMAQKSEKLVGLMDINTALMYFQSANMAFFLKENKIASQHYEKLLTIVEGIAPDKRLILADIYNYTAQAFERDKQYGKAAAYNIKSVTVLRKKRGYDKGKTAILCAKIAEMYILDNQYAECILYFKKTLNICKKQTVQNNHLNHLCYHSIGYAYDHINKPQAALKNYIQAFTALEPEPIEHHDAQANLAHIIGHRYYEKGKYIDTLHWYQKELLLIKQYSPQDISILDALVKVYISIINLSIVLFPKTNLLPYKQFLKAHFPTYKL